MAAEVIPVEYAGETNVGLKRTHNEDNFAIFEEENLYVVADGMGGHASGEVASQMAVESLRDFFRATSEDPETTWPYKMDKSRKYEENRLIIGVKLANLRIYETAQRDPRYRGMGTTIVSLLFIHINLANMDAPGESRLGKSQTHCGVLFIHAKPNYGGWWALRSRGGILESAGLGVGAVTIADRPRGAR